jgi:integrase
MSLFNAQLRTFREATSEDRLFPLWRLAVMSGMRRGEVLGLRWEDFDAVSSVVTVQRQWNRGERGLVLA